jgi:hypothetical protein
VNDLEFKLLFFLLLKGIIYFGLEKQEDGHLASDAWKKALKYLLIFLYIIFCYLINIKSNNNNA